MLVSQANLVAKLNISNIVSSVPVQGLDVQKTLLVKYNFLEDFVSIVNFVK